METWIESPFFANRAATIALIIMAGINESVFW
jgi:hypothetical protein